MSSGICSSYEPSTHDLSTNDLPNTATHGRLQFLTVLYTMYTILCSALQDNQARLPSFSETLLDRRLPAAHSVSCQYESQS